MDAYLQIKAERRDGMCVLRVAGELDAATTGAFTAHANAVLHAVPGPVAVDLTALRFVDAAGARALTQLLRSLSDSRLAGVTPCIPVVRRVLRLLGLPPPDCWPARRKTTAQLGTGELVSLVEQARADTSGTLARLQDTCIRLASTRERTDLSREQAQRALARTRASRERLARSLHQVRG